MTTHRQTVILIDDHPLFRKGLIQLLQTISDFEVAGEASNGKDGIALVRAIQPDLLLLDLNMKDMSGLEVLKQIKSADLDTRVVMITVSDQTEDLIEALRLGADGYLLKDMEPEDMIDSLASAAEGKIVVSENLTHMLAAALRDRHQPRSPHEAGLTDQERRIVELIAIGLSNKVIGRELGIAEGTVKVHVKHLLRKLDLRSRVEAAVWAVEHLHKAA